MIAAHGLGRGGVEILLVLLDHAGRRIGERHLGGRFGESVPSGR